MYSRLSFLERHPLSTVSDLLERDQCTGITLIYHSDCLSAKNGGPLIHSWDGAQLIFIDLALESNVRSSTCVCYILIF